MSLLSAPFSSLPAQTWRSVTWSSSEWCKHHPRLYSPPTSKDTEIHSHRNCMGAAHEWQPANPKGQELPPGKDQSISHNCSLFLTASHTFRQVFTGWDATCAISEDQVLQLKHKNEGNICGSTVSFSSFPGAKHIICSELLSYFGVWDIHPFTTCPVQKTPGIPLHKQTQPIFAKTFVNWFSKGLTPQTYVDVELCLALWKPGCWLSTRGKSLQALPKSAREMEMQTVPGSTTQPNKWACRQVGVHAGTNLAACKPRFGSRRNSLPHNTSEI